MATIRMTEHWCVPDIQEAYVTVYEYVYCDKCGSFDVGYQSGLPDAVGKALVVVIILAGLGVLGALLLLHGRCWAALLIAAIGLAGFVLVGASGGLQCRKCGNERFGQGNPMEYPDNDDSVIDVPRGEIRFRTVRRELGTTSE